jgi:hypothetical protein
VYPVALQASQGHARYLVTGRGVMAIELAQVDGLRRTAGRAAHPEIRIARLHRGANRPGVCKAQQPLRSQGRGWGRAAQRSRPLLGSIIFRRLQLLSRADQVPQYWLSDFFRIVRTRFRAERYRVR